MASLTRILDKADRELVADVQRVHVGAQMYRFLRVALFAFVASLPVTSSTGTLGWSVLASLGAGALETAFRQLWPAFPLDKATSVVTHAVKEQATQLATAAINAQVEDYKAGVATQNAITSFLAEATRKGQAAGAAAFAQASQPAETATPIPDAKSPAAVS